MTENRPLGYWLKLVDSLLDRQFEAIVEEHGVTRRQWQLLNLLAEAPATDESLNASLAPFLAASDGAETIQEQLEELLGSGWIAAGAGGYVLTELGKSSLATLTEVVERGRRQVVEGISEEEYDAALGVLERMSRNLGWEG